MINPSRNATNDNLTPPRPDVIEERSDEEDSSNSEHQDAAFNEAKVVVRTRKSGEFFFSRDGTKRRSFNQQRHSTTLAEIEEELKNPDF